MTKPMGPRLNVPWRRLALKWFCRAGRSCRQPAGPNGWCVDHNAAYGAVKFLSFLRWASKAGVKCKKHVWVCPKCYDCLACLHVEGCACGYFAIAPGGRCVVAKTLPGFATGA